MSRVDFEVGIVGGGVVGLTSAYYLAREGFSVGVFEKGECVACEASRWNAGLVVPSMYYPLPLSASPMKLLRWILKGSSPVSISLRSVDLRWTLKLLASKRELKRRASWRLLRRAWRKSVNLVEELVIRENIDCNFRRGNIIETYADRKMLEHALREVDALEEDGVEFEVLDSKRLRELEPALSDRVIGGILYRADAHLDPVRYSEGLARAVERAGADLRVGVEVYRVRPNNGGGVRLDTAGGQFTVGTLIVSAGPWTPRILSSLGVRLPVQPARGYVVYLKPTGTRLRKCLMLEDVKVVAAPTPDGGTRIGGVLDIVGYKLEVPQGRIEAILHEASKMLPYLSNAKIDSVHTALRPCTPDGVPVVGRLPTLANVIVATGHCRFGLTFSALTGELVARLVKGEELPVDLKFLSPERLLR